MKELSIEQIEHNWKKLRDTIENTFDGDRLINLIKMYDYFEDRMCMAPASGKEHYHYAHVGGYVEHVLHIIDYAQQIKGTWEKNGATINFTDEELIFAAMHHDLGKVGDMDNDHYLPNESDWHVKNQGKLYVNNPDIQFMTPPDRGLWILNQFGIKMTINEVLGIKLADGMYDDGNIQYLKSYSPEKKLKSNLPLIVHQADMATTRIEYEMSKQVERQEEQKVQKSVEKIKEAASSEQVSEQLSQKSKDLFDELFGDDS